MILNQAQAEAVYSAMAALNNVGGFAMIELPNGYQVGVFSSGTVQAVNTFGQWESFPSKAAFAAAYNLN